MEFVSLARLTIEVVEFVIFEIVQFNVNLKCFDLKILQTTPGFLQHLLLLVCFYGAAGHEYLT